MVDSKALNYSPAIAAQLPVLQNIATQALQLWDQVPHDAEAVLINVSENITFLVRAAGWRSILRLHRPNYHSIQAIESELAWSKALRDEKVVQTPGVYPGKNGSLIQSVDIPQWRETRQMVMFAFVPGDTPSETDHLEPMFLQLGEIAARMHCHSVSWIRPNQFQRFTWNTEAVFGSAPTWGHWRNAPNLARSSMVVLSRLENTLLKRLELFGAERDQYGLIHADMRFANLLVDNGETRLIDFDDCGFSWFLYDFAATVSFIEDHPELPQLQQAWVRGYQRHRTLTDDEMNEIPTFVMLRRMALLAWIGSHIDAPEPRELAPHFARVTEVLATRYLKRFS
ncbi:MAG: phosphotransferase [Acidiferrobacterales bacterium]|nr:phosphotransferase [Acidiferrobacterales bacterium]